MKRLPFQWSKPDPSDKEYVRSLEQAANTPEFRESLEREFPDGASELSSPMSRRSFMTLAGASLALSGLAACRRPEEHILPYTKAPEEIIPGRPTYYATAISLGTSVLGLLVESHEGRPTKIEGNPKHPRSLGATDSYTQAAILDLYDPDRSTGPTRGGEESEPVAEAHAAPAAHGEHGGEHGAAAAPKSRRFDNKDVLAFLKPRRDKVKAQAGRGLYFLSGALTSPTLLRLRDALKTEMPEARWATWEPICEDNVRAGSRLAFGEDLSAELDLEHADIVVALDADPLGSGPDSVRHSKTFAARRRPETAPGGMNRLYVVESAWTVTGTNADHRLRVKPSEITAYAVALAGELGKRGVTLAPEIVGALPKGGATVDAKFVSALADDLVKSKGKVAIALGAGQPRELHALVHAMHAGLESVGTTVRYYKALDAGRPLDRESLAQLGEALDKNQVEVLVVLGGNPAYDAPADLKFGERLKASKAAIIHLGHYRDETAKLSSLHIPRAHFLEAWGDVRSVDGVASIVQPLIAPLFKGLSDIELVSYLSTGKLTKGYDLVRETWREQASAKMAPPPPPPPVEPVAPVAAPVGAAAAVKLAGGKKGAQPAAAPAPAPAPAPVAPAEAPAPGVPNGGLQVFFDHYWRKALHEGLIEGSKFEPVKPTLQGAAVAQALPELGKIQSKALEIQFLVSSSMYDGRFNNNGWLMELPDPITKMVWDNAAILSMETAKSLGVEKDDLVRITVGGQTVEAAVYVQPGQAAGTLSIALGWGRKVTGRVGTGAGFDVYPLRRGALGFDEAQVQPAGAKYKDPRDEWFGDIVKITGLVSTQDHFAMEGRPLIREGTLTRFRKDPAFATHMVHEPKLFALWDDPAEFKVGQQWGMTIDLSSCVGCGACTIACQAENNIPIVGKAQVRKGREMHWIRIDRYFTYEKTQFFENEGYLNDNNTEVSHQPVPCMQCEHAPCENVCPVAATTHSNDGLNDMVYNRCVGTRYCANNCPWKVRRFNFLDFRGDVEEVAKLKYNPDVTVRSRGVMEKCTYCVQRIREAQRDVKRANPSGPDTVPDGIKTACAQVCPSDAITFGDIRDPNTAVSKAKANPRNYAMLAELNTRPRTTYMARVRNPNPVLTPEKPEAAGHGAAHGPAPAHGEAPAHGAAGAAPAAAPHGEPKHEAGASH